MRSQFVESLKRLYENGAITEAKVVELHKSGKITFADKEYVLGKQLGG